MTSRRVAQCVLVTIGLAACSSGGEDGTPVPTPAASAEAPVSEVASTDAPQATESVASTTTVTVAPNTTMPTTDTPATAAPPTTLDRSTIAEPAIVELPEEGGSVEVTPGGVWVFPHLAPVGHRVDPSTMEIDLTIDLPSYVASSVLAEGTLFLSTDADDGSFTVVDPSSGEIEAVIPAVFGDQPVFGFGKVWAVSMLDDRSIVSIDPATLEVERIPVRPSSGTFLLVAGTDRLWTLGAPDGLIGLDPLTGELTEPFRVFTITVDVPTNMRATASGTLLFATVTAIFEVDPFAQSVVGEIPLPEGLVALGPVDPGGGSLERPTFMFGNPEDTDPDRGDLPDVVIATVDVAAGALVDNVAVSFTEGARVDGRLLWTTPLRTPELHRVPLPGP